MEETHQCQKCGREVVVHIGSIGTRHQWVAAVTCKDCGADAELLDALEHLLGRVAELGSGGQKVPLPLWNALCIENAMEKARAAITAHGRPARLTN